MIKKTTAIQQGDAHLFQTLDDGEITINRGIMEMESGLQTASYLSLFGGSPDDSSNAGDNKNWWGNIGEPLNNQIRSKTQYLLNRLPLISTNLVVIEEAAQFDLKWLLDENIASSLNVTASIPNRNKINLLIVIEAQGRREEFNFTENWEFSL